MISFRPPPIRDESEEIWRRNLQSLLVDQPTGHAPDLLFQLYKLIKDVTAKSISISKESMKYFTGAGILIGNRISVLSDLLSTKEEPPRIWYNKAIPTTPRLSETLRFGVLEMQEHLETYFDRKDHVLECLETIKSSTKLALFSDTESAHEGTSNLTTNPFDPTV